MNGIFLSYSKCGVFLLICFNYYTCDDVDAMHQLIHARSFDVQYFTGFVKQATRGLIVSRMKYTFL